MKNINKKFKLAYIAVLSCGLLLSACGGVTSNSPTSIQPSNTSTSETLPDYKKVKSVEKTGETEEKTTYTITFEDGSTFTFDVPHGQDGEKGDKGDTGDKGDKGDTGATGATGNGISKVEKVSSDGLVDTYKITFTDGTSTTFTVTNGQDGEKGDKGDTGDKGDKGDTGATGATGNGISKVEKVSSDGLVDTYKITFTDGTSTTFTVTNGQDGEKGDQGVAGNDGLDGRGIESITLESDEEGQYFLVTYTDKETEKIYLPNVSGGEVVKVTYNVELDPNGGEILGDVKSYTDVEKGSTIALPLVFRDGYIFEGWYTGTSINDKVFTNYDPVVSDMTLIAKWSVDIYLDNERENAIYNFYYTFNSLSYDDKVNRYQEFISYVERVNFASDYEELNLIVEEFNQTFQGGEVGDDTVSQDEINKYIEEFTNQFNQLIEMYPDAKEQYQETFDKYIGNFYDGMFRYEFDESCNYIYELFKEIEMNFGGGQVDTVTQEEIEVTLKDFQTRFDDLMVQYPDAQNEYEGRFNDLISYYYQNMPRSDFDMYNKDIESLFEEIENNYGEYFDYSIVYQLSNNFSLALNGYSYFVDVWGGYYDQINSYFEQLNNIQNQDDYDTVSAEITSFFETLDSQYGDTDITNDLESIVEQINQSWDETINNYPDGYSEHIMEYSENFQTLNQATTVREFITPYIALENLRVYIEQNYPYEGAVSDYDIEQLTLKANFYLEIVNVMHELDESYITQMDEIVAQLNQGMTQPEFNKVSEEVDMLINEIEKQYGGEEGRIIISDDAVQLLLSSVNDTKAQLTKQFGEEAVAQFEDQFNILNENINYLTGSYLYDRISDIVSVTTQLNYIENELNRIYNIANVTLYYVNPLSILDIMGGSSSPNQVIKGEMYTVEDYIINSFVEY